MTYEEAVRHAGITEYDLGREAAERRCADGTAEKYLGIDLPRLFGREWTRGFTDYLRAWRMINAR